MQEYGTLIMFRGGDKNFRLYFPGPDGETPLDLEGFTVEVFEPHSLIENNVILSIEEPETGCVVGTVKWDDSYNLGSSMSFYIQLRELGVLMSAPKLIVKVI